MGKRAKATFVTSIVLIYVILAIIETVNLSSKTVDEAFEKFLNSEYKNETVENKIVGKEVYRNGNSTFVAFEVGNEVSLVQFVKGIFGWKLSYHSRDRNEGYGYSNFVDEINGDIILHGIIPRDIVTETKTITVNGEDANIVMLNEKVGIWLMMNKINKENFDNIQINFVDEVGNVIAEM